MPSTAISPNAQTEITEAPSANGRYLAPEVDIFETPDGYTLKAELPGVNKDGLEITLDGRELTLVGRRASSHPEGTLLHRETVAADFRRVFELDPAIDTGKIDAKLEQGVLSIHLPRSEKAKPRKVAVND